MTSHSVVVAVEVNGVPVNLILGPKALAAIASAVTPPDAEPSPYLTVPEAATLLCCKRQRVDDLLSQRRLSRYKDGSRTLVSRTEIDQYLSRPDR